MQEPVRERMHSLPETREGGFAVKQERSKRKIVYSVEGEKHPGSAQDKAKKESHSPSCRGKGEGKKDRFLPATHKAVKRKGMVFGVGGEGRD